MTGRRRARPGRVLALLLVGWWLASAAPAGARPARPAASSDDLETARRHFRQGERLYALGRFAEALKEYERSYEAAPLPELLFNIGQCHRNLENHDAAIFAFRKYLDEKPDAPNRAAVEALIGELELARARAPGPRGVKPVEPVEPVGPARPSRRPGRRTWLLAGGISATAVTAVVLGVVLWPREPGAPSSDVGNVDFSR